MLEDSVDHPSALARRHAASHDARLTHVYRSAIKGYAAVMSPRSARSVARDPAVANVEADREMATAGETYVPDGPQSIPPQLHRIFAADTRAVACDQVGEPDPAVNSNFAIDCTDEQRVDADIAVLDTAIDDTADLNVFKRTDCVHPDNPYGDSGAPYVSPDPESPHWHPSPSLNEGLEEEIYGCLENSGDPGDLSGYDDDPYDGAGHGTQTAYRAAGLDNEIGTVGVAPGARIWAVKVIDHGLFPELSAKPSNKQGYPMVAAYSFDEGSGAIVHDSGPASHHGTIEGATWTPSGKYGSALDFDGTNDLVSIADAPGLDLTDSFTLEAWVKPDSPLKNWKPLISKVGSGASNYRPGYVMSAQGYGAPEGYVATSSAIKGVAGTSALPTGSWSHLALTSDGINTRLYLNGELSGTGPAIAAEQTDGELEIGHTDSWLGQYFDGAIDEVRIWGLPAGKSQIKQDLNASIGLAHPDPVATYAFDEGSGSTLHDSAASHDGTIEGATWTPSGRYGSALDFDGTNDLVSIADAPGLDLTGSFTLEAWVRPDTATNFKPVLSKTETSGGNSGYLMMSRGNGVPEGYVAASGTTKGVAGTSALPTGSWSHLALTSDGTNLRLYVGGDLVATAAAVAAKATGAKLEIGRATLFNTYFDGLIDEVWIYDEPLNESQIEADRDEPITYDAELSMSHVIAGVDWVHEHADQIEVANMSVGCKLPWEGPGEDPAPDWYSCATASGEALNAAIDATIEEGVVFVVAAGNRPLDTPSLAAPQNNPNVIVTSVVIDADGVPSQDSEFKEASPFCGNEDTRAINSGFGEGVRMAAPFPCGITSGATPHVSGAAAVLASQCNPDSAADVEAIVKALAAEGNTESKANGGWDDTSGDGYKEPLLDVGNEEVFDPAMVGEEQAPSDCNFEHPDPVATYAFDEGSGSTLHDSGAGNHHGTIEGATWTSGKYGSALDFDGTNDLVSIADAPGLDLTGSFTLEAWVRPDTATNFKPVLSKTENSGGNSGYLMMSRGNGVPEGYVAASGTTKGVAGTSALPTGTWSHLALTSDGTNLRLYVGGDLAATAAAIAAKATNANLEIGRTKLFNTYFDGLIDQVRIYDETLSESQIETDRDTAISP
ncbi:MAG TPA: LamG-like jellyroll fold domain-containing protein [Solirubrobacterales bacterium]|nr:LamG-like jellyroll fold domain-containing protein [Solirubrobacterales bacterium]